MNQGKSLAVLIGGAMVGIGASSATASLITWEFAGEITSVFDENDLFAGTVFVGSPFSGSFTFESTTPDSSPTNPSSGFYVDAITLVSGRVGGFSFLGPTDSGASFHVSNDNPANGFDGFSVGAPVDLFGETSRMSLLFTDITGAIFDRDSLPNLPPALDLLDPARFRLSTPVETFDLFGQITLLVPDPGTAALLGVGALALVRRRHTRSERVW